MADWTDARARQLRANETDAERLLWRRLRDSQLSGLKFRRQQPIGAYIVDFVCFAQHLLVELDGGQHNEGLTVAHDESRTRWLEAQGFRVLRFWNNDVLADVEAVLTTIALAVGYVE